MSIAPKLRDMHALGADTCDPEFRDALLEAADEIDQLHAADDKIGFWLSAALDDPNVCEEMKADIRRWFECHPELSG